MEINVTRQKAFWQNVNEVNYFCIAKSLISLLIYNDFTCWSVSTRRFLITWNIQEHKKT